MRVLRNEQHKLKMETDNKSQLTNWLRRRTSSVSFMKTINEDEDVPEQSSSLRKLSPEATKRRSHVTLIPPTPTTFAATRATGLEAIAKVKHIRGVPVLPRDQKVLKEFVMFNLRLENARKRRQRKNLIISGQQGGRMRQSSPPATRAKRFMIEDSSASSNPGDSSLDRASRQVHLQELEANLSVIDNSCNAPSSSGGKVVAPEVIPIQLKQHVDRGASNKSNALLNPQASHSSSSNRQHSRAVDPAKSSSTTTTTTNRHHDRVMRSRASKGRHHHHRHHHHHHHDN